MAKEGSSPHACNATVSIEDVVVFPCVPATATLRESDIKVASACARVRIGKFISRARTSSTFVALIAVEKTTKSAPSTCSPLCAACTSAPRACSALNTVESLASEPVTVIP